jgi:hypothetical protein
MRVALPDGRSHITDSRNVRITSNDSIYGHVLYRGDKIFVKKVDPNSPEYGGAEWVSILEIPQFRQHSRIKITFHDGETRIGTITEASKGRFPRTQLLSVELDEKYEGAKRWLFSNTDKAIEPYNDPDRIAAKIDELEALIPSIEAIIGEIGVIGGKRYQWEERSVIMDLKSYTRNIKELAKEVTAK